MSEIVTTGRTVEQAKAELDGKMRLIRKLLDKAEGTTHEEERASYQAKAEELMRKYRIQQEQLIAADPIAAEPIRSDFEIVKHGSAFANEYHQLFASVAMHCGIRYRFSWVNVGGAYAGQVTCIGYEGDLRYAEFLFTAARLVFTERLEPQIDPRLDDAENVYRLRSAGIARNEIARMLWASDTHSAHAKVGRLYREACEIRGEDAAVSGRNVNAKTFRACYATKFVNALSGRLWRIRNAVDSTDGTMELAGRSGRVDEAFYAIYPEMRPGPSLGAARPGKEPKARKWTQADQARYERHYLSPAAIAAGERGATAALMVEIDRAPSKGRIEEDRTRGSVRAVLGLEIEG